MAVVVAREELQFGSLCALACTGERARATTFANARQQLTRRAHGRRRKGGGT